MTDEKPAERLSEPVNSTEEAKNVALGSIGAMRDAGEELDEIVADAYQRRNEPWRDFAVELGPARPTLTG